MSITEPAATKPADSTSLGADPTPFATPSKVCDIIMKGGITSGVVYPLALTTLAEEYRFSQIGGTSAGAMAAAAAAAAEYGRYAGSNAGFARLTAIPAYIGPNLMKLFQPSPALKPLFDVFIASLQGVTTAKDIVSIIATAVRGCWLSAAIGAVAGVLLAGGLIRAIIAALVGMIIAVILRLGYLLIKELPSPDYDYGLCPGIRQPGNDNDGFTDWLGTLIDQAAGLGAGADPLTFGDLDTPPGPGQRPAIVLRMMTTSLMESRPYALPNLGNRFVFEKNEWARIFPARIMTYLLAHCAPYTPLAGERGEYFHFPDPAHLPLLVAARMSLSFPALIAAVPLWRRDFTLHSENDRNVLRHCLFSDGGLSSNFPIHFFDHTVPRSPTFGITLDSFDPKRNWSGNVWLPEAAGSGIEMPVIPFTGLTGFLSRLLDSAKDWQDNLQSVLPGYRERIVHIALDSSEGGLNLDMSSSTVAKIASFGSEAATLLRTKFSLDDHRWRRFLVAMTRLEQSFDEFAVAYCDAADGVDSYRDFLRRFPEKSEHYKQSPAELEAMLGRAAELAKLGEAWDDPRVFESGNIPKPDTELKIAPKL